MIGVLRSRSVRKLISVQESITDERRKKEMKKEWKKNEKTG